MTNWYAFNEPKNGETIAYIPNLKKLMKFKAKHSLKGKIEEESNPDHLDFILKKEEETLASFEFEGHALQYNQIFYKGKGYIEPNPKE